MRPSRLLLVAAAALAATPESAAQVSLTTTSYTQNFDGLASSGTTNTAVPSGWSFLEGGTNGNVSYAVSAGSETAGNTYSFGAAASSERAFGVQQSGSLTSILGFKFTNNTGSTITALDVAYIGEQWRRAAAADTLAFSYQAADVALNAATGWTSVSALNFVTAVTGTGAALVGNDVANRISRSSGLTGLSIANGATVTFRWVDASGSSSAGMAIDDFSLTATLLAATGRFWGNDQSTWSSAGTTWASAVDTAGTLAQDASGNLVFGNAAAQSITVSGAVTAAAGITFATTGHSLSGGTSLTLSGANLAANTITVDSGVTATIGTPLLGSAGMTKAGAGTLILSGANSYTGGTTVSAGTLQVGAGSAAGSIAGNVANSGILAFDRSDDLAFGGNITGTGSLTKSGNGTLTLSGANTYSGGTTVSAGRLTGSTTSLQGSITNNAALTFDQGSTGTYDGVISGSGSVTKAGAGALTVSQAQTYTGGTTVSAGTLHLTGSTSATGTFAVSSGATLTGNGTVGGALSVASGGAVDLSTIAGASTLTAGSLSLDAAILTFELGDLIQLNSGALTLAGSTTISFTGAIAAETYKLIGFGSSTGTDANFSVTAPAGRWSAVGALAADGYYVTLATLAANLTWNGGTGTWDDTAANWLDGASASKFTGGDNVTIAGSSDQTVTLAAGLTVGNVALANTAGTTTLAGSGFAGGGSVTKTGAGTAVLAVANTFTGTVTVSAGTLRLGDAAALGSNSVGTTVSAGATLDLGGQSVGAETLALSGTLANTSASAASLAGAVTLSGSAEVATTGNVTLSGAVGGTGALTKSGNGTLTLSGSSNYSGGTTVSAGSLVGTTSSLQGDIANNASLTFDQASNGSYAGSLSGTGSLAKLGSGTVTLSGSASHTGGTTVSAGGLTLTGTLNGALAVSGGTVTLGSANRLADAAAVTLSSGTLALGANSDTVGSFAISGGSLTGSGTLTAASYSLGGGTVSANLGAGAATAASGSTALNGTLDGSLAVSGGTVTLGSANRLADAAAVTLSSGTLALGANSDTVGSFAISGGSLTGTGTLTAATYSLGGGTVSANLGAGAATASSGSTILNGTLAANLVIDGGTVTLGSANRIGNTATVTLSSGTLDLLGYGEYVDSFAITGGEFWSSLSTALNTANGFSLGGGTINGVLGAGLATAASGTTRVELGRITGNLRVAGGTVELASAGRLAATTNVTLVSGKLELAGNETVDAFAQSGGQLAGWGRLTATSYALTGGSVGVGFDGSGAVTSASGTTTLAASSAGFTGATTVSGGTLSLAHSAALGSGSVTLTSGSVLGGAGTNVANVFVIGSAAGSSRGLLAGWDFQTTAGGGTAAAAVPNTPTVFVANVGAGSLHLNGTQGSSSWVAASAGNELTAFGGTSVNTAGTSLSTATTTPAALALVYAGSSSNGKSAVFKVNMAGKTDLAISYAAQRTSTGFASHLWEYSADGVSWTTLGTFGAGSAAGTLASSFSTSGSLSLASFSGLDGVADAFVRLTVSGGSGSAGGNNRLDNIQFVAGTPVAASGSGTLGIAEAGSATFSGNVTIHGAATLTAATGGTATFSGVLSGDGSVTKAGAGTVVLSSANAYSGGTAVSAGTLRIGDVGSLGSGAVTVSGGVLDLNSLAPTNVILVSGGSLLNASAWAALGAVQLTGNVGSAQINNLGADITEVKVAAGATVNLAGVTKDIVFEGGSLTNLADFGSGRKLKVKGSLDVSAGDHGGELEVAAGGTLDFGNRSTSRAVKYSGGAVTGAAFTGNLEVSSAVTLSSAIAAGKVVLGNGASGSIQSGFNRDVRLETGATVTGLNDYSGQLTVAADQFSTTGVSTSATIAVESGSTLKGTGTVGSLVQAAGSTLAPGNSPGLLTVTGAHVLAGGSEMEVEFHDIASSLAPGVGYDAVVAGTLDLSGLSSANPYTLRLVSLSGLPSTQGALAGFDPTQSYFFDLLNYTTLTLPGSYTTANLADLFAIDLSAFDDQDGNAPAGSFAVVHAAASNVIQLEYTPVPEPSTYGLILGGLALAGAALRRRRKA